MGLDELASLPTLTVEVGGKTYRFGELTVGRLAALQAWLREHVPHPLDEIRSRLDGFPDAERSRILDRALDDARAWPPKIGTGEGADALLSTPEGQMEVLYLGLAQHAPDATRGDAEALYRDLKRLAAREAKAGGKATAERIFGTLFGVEPEDERLPEG